MKINNSKRGFHRGLAPEGGGKRSSSMRQGAVIIVLAMTSLLSCTSRAPVSAQTSTLQAESVSPEAAQVLSIPTGGSLLVYSELQAKNICYIEPTEELKSSLSPEEFAVLVQAGTEPPFQNEFWDNHRPGIYVDRIDGTALFASSTKFDSGTGWPSFWKPIDDDAIVLVEDRSYGMNRIEVRSRSSGGHLGHLFDDGPNPTGLRYCINSASLDFIPRESLEARGYGKYLSLF